ncbi:MAG TPA: ATP-binding cassette domain-containing protein [Mycobacteriales bacterium]|nr:ATP-binding cassette domain-containing protein [Mycobacteriales bacterium]
MHATSTIPGQRVDSSQVTRAGSLVVDGLVVDAPSGARLLDSVGFVVPGGSMLAVAGPTGAGKTTLARALVGAVPVAAGEIRVGGRQVTNLDPSRRGIGYVPQEDALHAGLSVRRTLDDAASLRMAGADAGERMQRVGAVLEETRLTGQAALPVSALSAGQRKRVAIAIELLSRPAVLVLDEPTSSLDPGYEDSVLTTLRGLADRGHGVVIVTHSQVAVAKCDRVVLLASGGRLAYFGDPARMHERFGTCGAGELFTALDAARPALVPGHPSAAFRATSDPAEPAGTAARPGFRSQLAVLSRRYCHLMFADRRRAWLLAVQGVVLGVLLMAFVTPDGLARPVDQLSYGVPVSATGMAVLLVTCLTWLGMSNAIREIVKERQILAREHRAGLSAAAYVGSKLAVLGPLLAVEATIVGIFAVQRQEVPRTGALLPSGIVEIVLALALAGISAVALGLLVSAVVRSADKALAVLPMLIVVEFVLSGLTPSVSWPGLAQLRDLAGTHWAVQAIEATVTGDRHSWLVAIAALVALTVASAGATLLVVRRSLRLPVARPARQPLGQRIRQAGRRCNPEMVRLARVGVAGLAAVALLIAGARMVIPNSAIGGTAPMTTVAADGAAGPTSLTDELPGVIGDLWWMWQTGTHVGIAATEAAYLRASLS